MEGTWEEKRKAILNMMEGKEDRKAHLLNKFALIDPEGVVRYIGEVINYYSIDYVETINEDHPTFGYNTILKLQGYPVGGLTRSQRNFLKNRGRLAPEIAKVMKGESQLQEITVNEDTGEVLIDKEWNGNIKPLGEE